MLLDGAARIWPLASGAYSTNTPTSQGRSFDFACDDSSETVGGA